MKNENAVNKLLIALSGTSTLHYDKWSDERCYRGVGDASRKKTLIDFYRELPEGQEGTDLGLYYLSYLDDACKKVNVKFESLVNQYSASDLTVINLNFNF